MRWKIKETRRNPAIGDIYYKFMFFALLPKRIYTGYGAEYVWLESVYIMYKYMEAHAFSGEKVKRWVDITSVTGSYVKKHPGTKNIFTP